MKNATTLAVCALSCALSVVVLFLGGITYILSFAAPMFIGLLMIMLKRTFGVKSAWVTFAATSLLSFILVTDRECMTMYVIFFGYYPIIRDALQKINSRFLRVAVKLVIYNCAIIISQLILVYVFGNPLLEEDEGKWILFVLLLLMNFMFVIYDLMVEKMNTLYSLKIEKRIKKIFK